MDFIPTPLRRTGIGAAAAVAFLWLGGFLACRAPESAVRWTRSLSEATREAAGKKLIIADLYTDWCGWCKEMDKNTWASPTVAREGASYVFLKLNAETEPDGIALQKRFGIRSYPTVMLLDASGDEFERLEGYLPAAKFLDKLRAVVSDPESLGNLRAQEASQPADLALRMKVGKRLYGRNAFGEARTRFEAIVAGDPDNRNRLSDAALFYTALCQANLEETDDALGTLERLERTFPSSAMVPNARLLGGEILIRTGRKDAARTRLEAFLRAFPEHELAPKARNMLSEI